MSEYNAGDLVEAVKGERVVRDRIVVGEGMFFAARIYIGDPSLVSPSALSSYIDSGYTVTVIEKAGPKAELRPSRACTSRTGICTTNSGAKSRAFGACPSSAHGGIPTSTSTLLLPA